MYRCLLYGAAESETGMVVTVRILYAALCAVLLALLFFGGSSGCLALLCALVLLPFLQLAVNLHCRKTVRAVLHAPANAGKNEPFRVVLQIENPSRLPILAAGCGLEVKNLLTGASERVVRRTAILPRGRSEVALELSSDCCGRIRTELKSLRLYDCFWLIPVRCGAGAHASVTVQPDTFPMEVRVLANVNSPEESEVYSQEKPGNDLTETFQIRDYREGDSIRQIHWKLSTKYDRLISRDPSLPVTRSVMVFWDRHAAQVSRTRQDAQAEVLVSLCRALLAAGVQFTLAWNEGGRCILQRAAELDDLIALLPRLLSSTARTDGPDGAELYCRTETGSAFAHVVYIAEAAPAALGQMTDGAVTALICGDDGAAAECAACRRFLPENCAETLAELEI
mgnify:FL=1